MIDNNTIIDLEEIIGYVLEKHNRRFHLHWQEKHGKELSNLRRHNHDYRR